MSDGSLSLELLLLQFPVVKYAIFGTVSVCGAVTRFLWDALRGVTKFTILGILLYCMFGFFIGNLAGSFVGLEYSYRDAILLLSGFVVKELFDILQLHGAGALAKVFKLDKRPLIGEKKDEV